MYRRAVRVAPPAMLVAVAATACVSRPRMCVAPSECGAEATCVAGRCQRNQTLPQIQNARRVLATPVAMAYVRRGDPANDGALPATFTLGRATDGDARLFLRFDVPLPREANIVEAYVVLHRAGADVDPTAIALHAARVVSPWDPRAVSWAIQPAIEDVRAPATFVTPAGRRLVRIDVRDLVGRWRAHDPRDQGIAVVAESTTATGVSFALAPSTPIDADETIARDRPITTDAGGVPPELELYLK